MKKELCIIIPCAGNGTRLGLAFSKELLGVDKNTTLIDYSFALFKEHYSKLRVVVIISEKKMDTVKYLRKYSDDVDLVFKYQNSQKKDFIGAIESAKDLYLDSNLVLLPDTIVEHSASYDLIEETLKGLETSDFLFWGKHENRRSILEKEGSIQIVNLNNEYKVVDYIDKPGDELAELNGYWAAFAFKKDIADECISILNDIMWEKSRTVFKESVLNGSSVIIVENSIDMGTWESIHSYYACK